MLIHPTELPTATIGTAKLVAVGTDHNVAINAVGQAYGWGFNMNYQCRLEKPTSVENTAVKNRDLTWAGCGGQVLVLAAVAEADERPERRALRGAGQGES